MLTDYPWLSKEHAQIAQLLDILNTVSEDRAINVGYPSDLLSDWKDANRETFAAIERMNLVANWSHDHYSALWREDPRTMLEMDKDETLGSGTVIDSLADLEALAERIMDETRRLESSMAENKVRWNDHWDDPRTKPISDRRDRLFVDFAQGSRKLERKGR